MHALQADVEDLSHFNEKGRCTVAPATIMDDFVSLVQRVHGEETPQQRAQAFFDEVDEPAESIEELLEADRRKWTIGR